jgi:hypothetical protein
MKMGFTIGAVVLGAVGAAMLVGAFTVGGFATTGLLSGGVTLIVVALVFFSVGKRVGGFSNPARMRQQGIAGRGTIVSIAETGMTINSLNAVFRFGLAVEVPGRPPYQVEISQAVPRVALGMIAPGRVVAVWVDQVDPSKVAIDFSIPAPSAPQVVGLPGQGSPMAPMAPMAPIPAPMAAPAMAAAAGVMEIDPSQVAATLAANPNAHIEAVNPQVSSAQAILDTGVPGRATVVNTFDLNMTTPDGDPVVGYVLNVQPQNGGAPYQVTLGHRTPRSLGRTPSAGAQLAVKIDPADAQQVAIDWSASVF